MSMWRTSHLRTPCEVLREINDIFQGDTDLDKMVRHKLAEVETKTKEMSLFIDKYDKKFHERWEKNADSAEDFNRRHKDKNTPKETYKYTPKETYKYHKHCIHIIY